MNWHAMTIEQVLNRLQVQKNKGLTNAESQHRKRQVGENRLLEKKHTSVFVKFLEQWKDFMILTLIGAAILSTVVSFLHGERDLTDPLIILVIITVNAILGVIQETKAEKSLDALKRMSAPVATVLRDGRKQTVDAASLVPGDVVYLEAGCFVPADGRLLESLELKVEESALTGESVPVEKQAISVLKESTPVAERSNMVLSTTIVTAGRGKMVVTETGMNTQVGHIAGMILTDESKETPLQKRLAQTSKVLGLLALGICVIMFFVGLWKDQPLFEMFMTAVSLAVAAIPEGLPAIVTILLSQGVQRMAMQHAVVRKLPAVETLGSATVICSDKTGTLTQNRMTVTQVASVDGKESMQGAFAKEVLQWGALCNNAGVSRKKVVLGDPTEVALVEAAAAVGCYKEQLELQYPRRKEIPFDSRSKRMTTIHQSGSQQITITKGAPDVVAPLCQKVCSRGKVCTWTEDLHKKMQQQNELMAGDGLRVLAIAKDGCFLGLVGMMDPPRPQVREAVRVCQQAGIRPVMITGDHPATAMAIAEELGILGSEDNARRSPSSHRSQRVLTGPQLEVMFQEELMHMASRIAVYARVSPEHKVRIVKALQANGQVVAMTGDGVNDAPALKAADIGCAMGRGGTDVAKTSADMVLTDDNFATIVAAVKEGRVIYQNIRKTIHFLLSSNFGEILTIFVAIVMGYGTPLLPVQLLWMNLVTDSLPAIALGSEPADRDVMQRPPIPREQGIFSQGLAWQMLLEGAVIGGLALMAFLWGDARYGLTMARTMAFSVLSLSQLFHVLNVRSQHSLFCIGLFSNGRLLLACSLCLVLQIGVVMIPSLASIFQVMPMNLAQWGMVMGLSVAPIPIIELQKWFNCLGEREE